MTLRKYPSQKPPTEYNTTKNCMYSNPCSCGKVYKGKTCQPLKVGLEEHQKSVSLGEFEKLLTIYKKKRETTSGMKLK